MSAARGYDAIAEFYDDDMGRNADGGDIGYYRDLCRAAVAATPGPVLELGCGTGRITLALAAAGLATIGADFSPPMLRVLRRKAMVQPGLTPPRLVAMDMARPALEGRFAAVICPFSAFTYLLEDADRERALAFAARTLLSGGRFAIDVFVADPSLEKRAAEGEVFDYRRPLPEGGALERHKTIARNIRPGINRIRRRYTFLTADGAVRRELVTDSLQRPCAPAELQRLVEQSGLRVTRIAGDFAGAPLGPGSRAVVLEAEPAGP